MTRPDSLSTHLSRWERALAGRQKQTREMWIDRLVASNKTWAPDELVTFWNQNREPSNYPIIHPVVESVCGMEAQTRRDTTILGRTRAQMESAEALTALVKYVDQQNKTPFVRSKSFRHAVVDGVGFTETCWSDDPRAETIAKRAVDPMHIWLDPATREDDLSDAMDVFRARWLPPAWVAMRWDLSQKRDFGVQMAPNIIYDPLSHSEDYNTRHGDEPPVALFNEGWGGDPNFGPGHGIHAPLIGYGWATQDADNWWKVNRYENLVLVVERWYRADEWAHFVSMRNGVVIEVTPKTAQRCAQIVLAGEGRLIRAISKRIRCACFIASGSGGLLQDVASPYPHGQFPFVPTWAYRDEEGQPLGLVRLLRDATREFNMRRTHLTKRTLMRQVHYENDAFEDEDEALRELAKYNGAVRVKQGRMDSFKIVDNAGMDAGTAQMEFNMLQGALQMVQNLGPVNQEALGQETNAKSGVAIEQRQQQAQTSLFSLFDARNWAQQVEGEQTLALIQEAYTEEKEIRITGSKRGLEYININQKDPASGMILNDISQGRYDVTVDAQPEATTARAAKTEVLSQLLQSADLPPDVRMKVTIAVAEAQELPTDVLSALDEAYQMLIEAQQAQAQQAQMAAQMGAPPGAPSPVPPDATQPPPQAGVSL